MTRSSFHTQSILLYVNAELYYGFSLLGGLPLFFGTWSFTFPKTLRVRADLSLLFRKAYHFSLELFRISLKKRGV